MEFFFAPSVETAHCQCANNARFCIRDCFSLKQRPDPLRIPRRGQIDRKSFVRRSKAASFCDEFYSRFNKVIKNSPQVSRKQTICGNARFRVNKKKKRTFFEVETFMSLYCISQTTPRISACLFATCSAETAHLVRCAGFFKGIFSFDVAKNRHIS